MEDLLNKLFKNMSRAVSTPIHINSNYRSRETFSDMAINYKQLNEAKETIKEIKSLLNYFNYDFINDNSIFLAWFISGRHSKNYQLHRLKTYCYPIIEDVGFREWHHYVTENSYHSKGSKQDVRLLPYK